MNSSINELKSLILTKVEKAQKNKVIYSTIKQQNSGDYVPRNEFLFFIKPEITLQSEKIQLNEILDLVFNQINHYHLNIDSVSLLSADYLKTHNIIAQHYGVINKIASNAKKYLSEGANEKFNEIFGCNPQKNNVLGGFEFLETFPAFNPESLDYLWQNSENKKLNFSTSYCSLVNIFCKSFNFSSISLNLKPLIPKKSVKIISTGFP